MYPATRAVVAPCLSPNRARMNGEEGISTMTTPGAHHNAQPPTAAEQRMEVGRLYCFDLPVLSTAGNTLPEQLETSSIHRVLDVACGSGEWVQATAQAYPHMQ